jgi:biopolymer transport protein ExbD
MRNISLFILTFFSLTACQTELSVLDIPNENKLVVQSFISPQDTLLSVRVSNTNAIIGQVTKEFKTVSNAVVTIGNGTKNISLPYDKEGYYRVSSKQLAIKAGQTYFLQVNTPDGRSVSAECTIPVNSVDAKKVSVDIQSVSSNRKFIVLKWDDIPNQQNYYGISATYDTPNKNCNNDILVVRNKNREGDQFTYSFNTDTVCGNGSPNYIIVIANYDLNGYQFLSSLSEQNSVNGIPFTEPVQIYSNIKGGYGVFSGYYQLRTMVKVF